MKLSQMVADAQNTEEIVGSSVEVINDEGNTTSINQTTNDQDIQDEINHLKKLAGI